MRQSTLFSALFVSLVLGTPACGSKFVSLGDEDAGSLGMGGANQLNVGGSSFVGAGGSADCVCTDPGPKMPNQNCSDGTIGGPVCERDASGACGWSIRSCPVENAGGSSSGAGGAMPGAGGSMGCVCGDPIPNVAHQICSDGSVVAPYCEVSPSGTCAWAIRECPVAGAGGSANAGGAMAAGGAIVSVGGAMNAGGAIAAVGGSFGCACGGPMPNIEHQVCSDGSVASVYCELYPSGACGWAIRECPIEGAGGGSIGIGGAVAAGGAIVSLGGAMSAGGAIATVGGSNGCACSGPMPKMANYLCADGSVAGPVCEPDASGICSWQIRSCPVENAGGSASAGGAAAMGGSAGVTCEYNGSIFSEGQSFPALDSCNICYCMAAGVACTKMNCATEVGGASSS